MFKYRLLYKEQTNTISLYDPKFHFALNFPSILNIEILICRRVNVLGKNLYKHQIEIINEKNKI